MGVQEWIVRLSNTILDKVHTVADAATFLRAAGTGTGLEVVEGLGLPGQVLVRSTVAVEVVERYFATDTAIASFSRNGRARLATTPNDPSFTQLYGLDNIGQSGGIRDADIDAPEAWNVTTGSSSIVVGVIDTGIDHTHPDLAVNIWTNPGEVPGNGLDDDANGFVDDVHGYDFANNDGDPLDDHGHGTHVSGTIGAVGNNATGVVGVNWNVSLMALKFLDASGSGYTSDAIRAVNYATMMRSLYGVNVRVTNNSWGGGGYDVGLRDAIDTGGTAGIMFVAAAGNESANADAAPGYPAAYDSAAIVSVAATDNRDALAWFSNYGAGAVDLAAPGVSILSTLPGSRYGSMSGTSMATPHVAGAAALVLSVDSTLSVAQLKRRLLDTVDPIPALAGRVASGGRLNAAAAVSFVAGGPTLSIASSTPVLRRGETATISFALTSPATDFTAADVTVSGGTLSGFSGSGTTYTAMFTPTAGFVGTGTVTVEAGGFTDDSGRANARVSLTPALVIDTATLEVFAAPLALGFAADGSFVGPTIGARWNGVEFLRYGTFLANWTVAIDGRSYGNAAAAGLTSFPVAIVDASTGGSREVRITGSPRAGVNVVRTVRWLDGDDHAIVTTTITNNSTAPLSRIAVLENDDPDPDGIFDTYNDVLRGGRLVVGSAAGGAMALGSADPRAVASAEGFFIGNPSDILLSPVDPNGGRSDTAINIAFDVGTLAPGASDSTSFAMIFGADQEAVASRFDTIAGLWPPSVAITTNKVALRADEVATITFTLTKPSTTFTAAAVTVTGGTLSNFTGSGTTYSAAFTPLAGYVGRATVTVAGGGFTDAGGVANLPGALATPISVDALPPSIVITTSRAVVKAGATAVLTFRLSEAAKDFSISDVAVTGGTLSNFSGSGTTYTATFTPTAGFDGVVAVAVAAGGFTDAFGNPNVDGMLDPAIRVDTISPTLVITADRPALKIGETARLTFTLSESPASFTVGMVTVAGGWLSGFTGSGTSYTATFTPGSGFTGAGTVTVNAGRFVDGAGNGNLAATLTPSLAIDTKLPTVAITTSRGGLKVGEATTLTFTLSEPAVDFTAEDVAVTGGLLTGFAGAGTIYTATFAPTAGFSGSGTVTVAAGTFTDAAGNGNLRAGLSPALAIDARPPTVAITSNLQTLRAGATAALTFRLSEAAKDFDVTDVAVTGGTLSNFAGTGTTYTATFTPVAGLVGTGTVAIEAGAFTDAAGNGNVAGALATPLRIDLVVPTLVITADRPALKAGETARLTFTLSESPASFTVGMVTVAGGWLSGFTGSGTSYTATFTPGSGFTGAGTVTVNAGRFVDGAGNGNLAATLTPSLAIDTKLPTVAITSSLQTIKAGTTAVITFRLSEAAKDFDLSVIAVTGGTLSKFAGSGTIYTATFTPTAGLVGTGVGMVAINAGAFTDLAGNANVAATLPSRLNLIAY